MSAGTAVAVGIGGVFLLGGIYLLTRPKPPVAAQGAAPLSLQLGATVSGSTAGVIQGVGAAVGGLSSLFSSFGGGS